jgi:hypothetical protein
MNRPFERFVNHLAEITKNNKNIKLEVLPHGREVKISYNKNTFQSFRPTFNRKKRSVEFGYGRVAPSDRGKGLGTRLRNYGVRAARAAQVSLFHEGVNMESIVREGNMPPSTRIVRFKLGAEPAHGLWHPRTGRIVKPKTVPSIFRFHRYSLRPTPHRRNRNRN